MEKNNEILKDARFIVNTYIDNFQTVVYDDYNYPYPHYGITADQYDEMVADMKKGFEEILNNFKEAVEVFLNTYKEYEDIIEEKEPTCSQTGYKKTIKQCKNCNCSTYFINRRC